MALLDKFKQLLPGSGGSTGSNRADKSLDSKFAITGGLLIGSITIVAILLFLNTKYSNQNKVYSALAQEQQVISQQLAINTLAAVAGDLTVFDKLLDSQSRYNEIILILDNGSDQLHLSPLPEDYSAKYSALKSIWKDYDKNVSTIVAAKPSIEMINNQVIEIRDSLPRLISLSTQVTLLYMHPFQMRRSSGSAGIRCCQYLAIQTRR